jgi:hypothetical protein
MVIGRNYFLLALVFDLQFSEGGEVTFVLRYVSKNIDSAADRTQSLWFRRPAPYPLGHGVVVEV